MPRSDRLYVFIVVGLASILVLISLVATVSALTGKSKPPPKYESAPAKALSKPNPSSGSIIDADNAVEAPIDDASFLSLHRETRILSLALAKGQGFGQRALDDGLPADMLVKIKSDRQAVAGSLKGYKPIGKPKVLVYRPQPTKNETDSPEAVTLETYASVEMVSPSGDSSDAISFTYYWESDGGPWQLDAVAVESSVVEQPGKTGSSSPVG